MSPIVIVLIGMRCLRQDFGLDEFMKKRNLRGVGIDDVGCAVRLFLCQTRIDDDRVLRRIEETKPCLYPRWFATLSTTP